MGHALGEERAVGEARQGVVVRLVLELLLESRQRAERLFQLAVLECDRGVAGEGLEQLEIVGVERTEVAQTVRDEDRTDQARLADERRVDRIAEATATLGRRPGIPMRDEEGPALRHALHELRVVEGRPDRFHHVGRLARTDARPQDFLTIDLGQQRHFGDLGAEHLAGMVEQRHKGTVDLGAALQDPGGLVQHLETLVLLALGHVRPVGDEDRDDRNREQKRRRGLDEQDRDHEQRKAGVCQGHHGTHQQHARDPGVSRGSLGEGDRGSDGEHSHHVLGGCRQERRRPFAWSEGRADREEQVSDADRDHGA